MVIKPKFYIIGVLLVLSFSFFSIAESWAKDDLSIGRMRLSIWPEYDDPGVLVIYDGRFVDEARFPTKTFFYIPKGAVISDVCSLSPEGAHYCQLYEVINGDGEQDKVLISMPFPNFYMSFHTSALDIESENREFKFSLLANHVINKVEVDIQQPLRTSAFTIAPGGGERGEDKGFNHFKYEMDNIAKGEEQTFDISYLKSDTKPSVDIKYGTMASNDRVWGSPYDRQRYAKSLIYIVFGVGVAIVLAGLSWIVVIRRRKKGISADGR